jgi:hypothetical protein
MELIYKRQIERASTAGFEAKYLNLYHFRELVLNMFFFAFG